ncbi:zinc-dependent peptidase [Ferruginibacter sp. SUN002]|uniref:zinc-dependent peptidase n=1 Tax=Ferruginibacter sp. SUN002 TaxID=2937789 RepID=UPI003D369719
MPQDSTTYTYEFKIGDADYKIESPTELNTHSIDSLINNFNTVHKTSKDYVAPSDQSEEGPNMILIYCFIAIVIFLFIFCIKELIKHYDYYTSNWRYRNPDYYEYAPAYTSKWDPTYDIPTTLTYHGNELDLSRTILTEVLNKRFPYYTKLNGSEKDKFISRLQKFIESRTFIIHDESGFKEMPILISATAIQLSFGFEKYLLPDFPNIHIYPEEFLGVHPSIRYLEGNVSGNSINISWKHFLNGFKIPDDGQNVGLHEMAHAYHFQNFETGRHEDEDFTRSFPNFNLYANKAFAQESTSVNDLYTDYALRNFQEFWAESVEIFFEKPTQMKNTYPELYSAMCDLLNQQPS